MSENVTLNGNLFIIPDVGENGWGQNLTNYFVAIPAGVLQKTGGLFTLTADVDFGAAFGLKAKYLITESASPATSGVIRLAATDSIDFGTSNYPLTTDGSGNLTWRGNKIAGSTGAVSSITGTANEVIASAATGDIVLSLPQAIATSSTPVFASETLSAVTNQLILGATRTVTLTAPTPATASRTWTIPDIGSDATIVSREAVETFSGAKSFSQNVTLLSQKAVVFNDNAGSPKTITLSAPAAVTTSYPLVWPVAQGSNGQSLINDGSGNLSWGAPTTAPGGADSNIQFNHPAGTFAGSSALTFVVGSPNILTANAYISVSGTAYLTGDSSNPLGSTSLSITPVPANTAASLVLKPSGSNVNASFFVLNSSDYANSSYARLFWEGDHFCLTSGADGSGTPSDLRLAVNSGAASLRIKTTGVTEVAGAFDVTRTNLTIDGSQTYPILTKTFNHTETTFVSSSASFVDTNLSLTLTPRSANSKFVIYASGTLKAGTGSSAYATIHSSVTGVLSAGTGGFCAIPSNSQTQASMIAFDSPGTTSPVTWTVQIKTDNAGINALFPDNSNAETPSAYMIVEELSF